jgi:transcription antitermination factor NusG
MQNAPVDGRYWFALIAHPQHEFEAQAELERMGVEAIVPRIAKEVRKHRLSKSTVVREYPLWSRYVFAGFTQPRPWYAVNRIDAISGAVGFEGEPLLLPASTVRYVQSVAAQPIEIKRDRVERATFKIGDRVMIARGPFLGHIAELSAIRRKSAELLLDIFGSIQGVSIPLDHIEQAAA